MNCAMPQRLHGEPIRIPIRHPTAAHNSAPVQNDDLFFGVPLQPATFYTPGKLISLDIVTSLLTRRLSVRHCPPPCSQLNGSS